jgi:hypothetical protein
MNNGNASLPPIHIANPMVDLLERLLVDARSGAINTLGVIAVAGNGNVATFVVGGRLGDVYVGAGIIQTKIIHQIDPPQGQKTSSLIRATVGG